MRRLVALVLWALIAVHGAAAQALFHAGANGSSNATLPVVEATADHGAPITIPAGTHLFMRLSSALHTVSATPGSGVYLETLLPVVANDRVVIPIHTRVLGVMELERRPGRVHGRAAMRMRFTQLILPDNRVLTIAADLQSLPGSASERADSEGTIQPVDQIDPDVYLMVKTVGAGVLIGSISHIGIGVGPGALMGAGLGLGKILFTRGHEISLPAGTRVEMVLRQPLTLRSDWK